MAGEDHVAEDHAVTVPRAMPPPPKLRGWDFYRTVCKSARLVLAPMVDASELPWRVLSRRYGAQLTYTPMFHALNFATSKVYRERHFTTTPEDRPLFVQFCANSAETLLQAARHVEDRCDAVDLNLGCPQNIARRGHYGAFLQDEWELIESMVRTLDQHLRVPITCKIRVFADIERSVAYARMLERAGCSMLAVHGRLREQKGVNTGLADWNKIRAIKEAVSIPVIANGNILDFPDIERCLAETGADGVMSAEGNLYNPALFAGVHPPSYEIAREYLQLCQQYPTNLGYVRGHVFKMLHHTLAHHPEMREVFNRANSIEANLAAVDILEYVVKKRLTQQVACEAGEAAPQDNDVRRAQTHALDGYRTIPYWRCQPYVRSLHKPEAVAASAVKRAHEDGSERQADAAAHDPGDAGDAGDAGDTGDYGNAQAPPPNSNGGSGGNGLERFDPADEQLQAMLQAYLAKHQHQEKRKHLKRAKHDQAAAAEAASAS